MNRRLRSAAAFSLVELTLALGIAAFCLIALFGLVPIGIQTNRNATSQTSATNIMAAVVADLRATPKTNNTSSQFCIPLATSTTLYFDSAGRCSKDSAGSTSPCGVSWVPPLQTRYQLNVTWSTTGGCSFALPCADLKVTWPAAAVPANASGSTEMLAAFDRN